jgi:hypothetical protein
MLSNKTKIAGYMGGVKVLHMNIDCLCPWETIQKICDVLREDINKLGDGIDFEITVTDTDI